ncbi:Bidirectional sugar transporter SWEET12 [Seminavis robusta]|uniref:Sugar transporter SWEET1 n=1 Tax=Seminavis robusta TaxID=568900 RepID=A0A9N8ESS6_9STRA|nr:Bidirectional sugar transporter SWEET12 [Seminavis robusta]|eukprot:Sro1579_g283730.1 Bidirectional sugar transporter SWEET12 (397) ;mRNA; r:12611-14041
MKDYISPDDGEAIPAWVVFCAELAPFSSILMFLSPIPTIRQVLRNGTVGDLPLLPYTSMVTSCFVWILYGILKREPLIYVCNIVEFILSVYYFVEFTNYAPKQSPTFPGSVYAHIKFAIGTWAVSLWIAIFFSSRVSTIGDLTVVLTILTFASPLVAVKAVLESQSSESIPWPFTIAALFNCCLWTIVGVFEMHDIYVYFPAVLGLVFAGLQVALKLYFGDNNNNDIDNPSYMRTPTAPVEMPYPVLESVRHVVMMGSNLNSSNRTELPDHRHHHGVSQTDYIQLGLPLTGDTEQYNLSPPHGALLDTGTTSSSSVADVVHFGSGQIMHHKPSRSNDGLESLVFDETTTATSLPFPTPLTESFRSRSGSIQNGQPTQHGGGLLAQPQQQPQHGHPY